ncbi:hydrolase [Labrys okinawensis]|uniref:hydrolase n=1 Tax=Labrys okinawensis TaxID=346911 RepID=UPI0039BD47A8
MLNLDPRHTALVLIDLQNWIVNRPLAPHSGEDVVDRSIKMARALRKAGGTVVLVRVAFSDGYGDVVKVPVDSPMILPEGKMPAEAIAFDSRISTSIADVVITKRQWSAFHGTELDLQLRRRAIDTVIVSGIATNFGVEATVRDAFAYNYAPVVPEDAVSSMSAEMHRFSIDHVMPRIARIRPTAEIIRAIKGG